MEIIHCTIIRQQIQAKKIDKLKKIIKPVNTHPASTANAKRSSTCRKEHNSTCIRLEFQRLSQAQNISFPFTNSFSATYVNNNVNKVTSNCCTLYQLGDCPASQACVLELA